MRVDADVAVPLLPATLHVLPAALLKDREKQRIKKLLRPEDSHYSRNDDNGIAVVDAATAVNPTPFAVPDGNQEPPGESDSDGKSMNESTSHIRVTANIDFVVESGQP